MAKALWAGESSRRITRRIVVEGHLVLETPAHFGNGDTDDLTDMPLLVDPFDDRTPLLTGASIAGALRSYLREREHGYDGKLDPKQPKDKESFSVRLFGGMSGDDKGEQSPLVVDDALGEPDTFGVEMRHGVRIEPRTRTARDKGLFDFHLWQAGTSFPLRFELLIREQDDAGELRRALATALVGFTDGGITLGARKHRGYGRVRVDSWRVTEYDLTTPEGLLAWLAAGRSDLGTAPPTRQDQGPAIAALLSVMPLGDVRRTFTLDAEFTLDGSLLIRSGGGKDDTGPDIAYQHARQEDGSAAPVLAGTSLAGALRARALRIASTLAGSLSRTAKDLVDAMWGADEERDASARPWASRIAVWETAINSNEAVVNLVQNRVGIDRFTGGARDTALFSEQPVFAGNETAVKVKLELANPEEPEVGLLLLLLKDLWTGDLPLGGESSVGRGRLKGRWATLTLQNGRDAPRCWRIEATDRGLALTHGRAEDLERFVGKLCEHLKGGDHEARNQA